MGRFILTNKISLIQDRLDSIVKGKSEAVRLAITALLARGHLLIEDIPGVGKTTLAFALARSIDCSFHRVQFTSDLMPSDIIGVSIFNPEVREFEFRQGPLFTNILLADEINRTNPKTQSALLEAMNEKRVSVDLGTYALPEPFMVIATQNPLEYRGTFPLPESQLDRFMLHIRLGYPEPAFEKQAVLHQIGFDRLNELPPVVSRADLLKMQKEASAVRVEDSLADYLMRLVAATRTHEKIALGASTRGAQFLLNAAKAYAYCSGRDFLLPDDIKRLAAPVLAHRLILRSQKSLSAAGLLIKEIADKIAVPV